MLYPAELLGHKICMERVKGIEPSSSAWKAEVLPLNYTRVYIVSLSMTGASPDHASFSATLLKEVNPSRQLEAYSPEADARG